MDSAAQFLERAQALADHHAPQDVAVPVLMIVAGALVVFGLGMSVLGAKLARSTITTSLALIGAGVGLSLAGRFDFPAPISGLLGAGILGVLGFVLYRLWVGLATGALMVVALNATYGTHVLSPQLQAYQQAHGGMPALVKEGGFKTPDPAAQAQYLNPNFKDWARGFWDFSNEQAPGRVKQLGLISACAGLAGLILGLLAVRFTLVTVTSIVGTVLISFGAFALTRHWKPDLYEAGLAHPQAVGLACAAFLLGSLILQALLTRPDKSSSKPAKA